MPQQEQWVTIREAASACNVHENTVRNWVRLEKIKSRRNQLSRIIYVDLVEIREKLGQLPTA